MQQVNVIHGINLDQKILDLINESTSRHFGDPPLLNNNIQDSVFFTILSDNKLLATGRLHPIDDVKFNYNNYSILGIGGILSNEKGKGYGKQIMNAICLYLLQVDKTGIAFCVPKNRVFYEKCGFGVNTTIAKQFRFPIVYGKELLESDDCVIYQEGSDKLISKVIGNPNELIYFPCHPW